MSDDNGNTEFQLPIICPHCSKTITMAMLFALLAPEKESAKPLPLGDDGDDSEDENQDDIPPTGDN